MRLRTILSLSLPLPPLLSHASRSTYYIYLRPLPLPIPSAASSSCPSISTSTTSQAQHAKLNKDTHFCVFPRVAAVLWVPLARNKDTHEALCCSDRLATELPPRLKHEPRPTDLGCSGTEHCLSCHTSRQEAEVIAIGLTSRVDNSIASTTAGLASLVDTPASIGLGWIVSRKVKMLGACGRRPWLEQLVASEAGRKTGVLLSNLGERNCFQAGPLVLRICASLDTMKCEPDNFDLDAAFCVSARTGLARPNWRKPNDRLRFQHCRDRQSVGRHQAGTTGNDAVGVCGRGCSGGTVT